MEEQDVLHRPQIKKALGHGNDDDELAIENIFQNQSRSSFRIKNHLKRKTQVVSNLLGLINSISSQLAPHPTLNTSVSHINSYDTTWAIIAGSL